MLDRSILEWSISYRKLKVLAAACKLKIFTLLADGPQSADELAALCGAKLPPLRAVLDACVALELLDVEGDKYTSQAEAETFLVEDKSQYLGNLVQLFSSEAPQWEGLNELLQHGRAPDFEPVSSVNPRQFTLAMHSFGMLGEAEALVEAVSLEDARDLIDIGCGSGVYSVALCKHYQNLRATLIDREKTLEVTQEIVAGSGVADRITLLPGDITRDSYGKNRDVVLLSDVLYGPPSVCSGILTSAYEALEPGGIVIIRGYFSDPGGQKPVFGALFDVARMLWDPANEPLTLEQLCLWLEEIGFNSIEPSPLTELSSLLTASK